MTEQEVRKAYLKEDWGKLLHRYGFDPFNTESCAREVARKAASEISRLKKTVRRLVKELRQK